jgi:hypothetical protein
MSKRPRSSYWPLKQRQWGLSPLAASECNPDALGWHLNLIPLRNLSGVTVFWDVTPCSSIERPNVSEWPASVFRLEECLVGSEPYGFVERYQRFRAICCLNLEGETQFLECDSVSSVKRSERFGATCCLYGEESEVVRVLD